LALVGWAGIAHAQTASAVVPGAVTGPGTVLPEKHPSPVDPAAGTGEILQTGCSTCGNGLIGGAGGGDCAAGCYPGRKPCDCSGLFGDSCFGRMFGGMYECLCC